MCVCCLHHVLFRFRVQSYGVLAMWLIPMMGYMLYHKYGRRSFIRSFSNDNEWKCAYTCHLHCCLNWHSLFVY